jgi:hypothetical protein
VKDADADEKRFDALLNVLTRLCEAIETHNEIALIQLQDGDEEESGPVEPQPL